MMDDDDYDDDDDDVILRSGEVAKLRPNLVARAVAATKTTNHIFCCCR